MLLIQLGIVLACIFVGARIGGLGLGIVPGLGLLVLVWVFGNAPSGPPVDVLLIILAVITAAATLQAAGGLDYLVALADRLLRKKPEWITFVGPIVSYLFTFCAGTGHVAYSILPVIAEVSRKAGVRPERPMSISVIASQQAITASPLSAATAGMIAILAAKPLAEAGGNPAQAIGLAEILLVCVPATLAGVLLGAISVYRKGVELAEDPEYRRRLAAGEVPEPAKIAELSPAEHASARRAVAIFLGAALLVVVVGVVPGLRPAIPADGRGIFPIFGPGAAAAATPDAAPPANATSVDEQGAAVAAEAASSEPIGMVETIQIVMLCAAAAILLVTRASPDKAVRGSIMRAGIVAVVSILGIAWLGNCFVDEFKPEIVARISDVATARPWTFAIGLFALSILLYSQAATVAALMGVGVAIGIHPILLVAMFPAVNGYFFLPTYGTVVAAINFDPTGTTHIGRFVLNHSFMRPGLVATIGAVAIGMGLVTLYRALGWVG
ncbi:MAG TPA: anaerobic C4-dicarboxylate transporter [Phycisphaerales bacterium]|nr:anaerobic C4-dicarboxylate transporter [Phycisphaerales bacterium]HMP37332.1 anaerobic C4-dicarboxylate transporter [Phycisphaerales bacterium]